MPITIVKGLNYTQRITSKKDSSQETVQQWQRFKPRKPEECGMWVDGKKLYGYEGMEAMGVTQAELLFTSQEKQTEGSQ
jgi:hypothetical protein